jgi:hypothetical protein
MITFALRQYGVAAAMAALLATPALSRAEGQKPTTCDRIGQDVRQSIEKDPAKVLMIVEDALVINETCACEIVKAAITASNADEALLKQIVQTSIAVAPKMTAVIEDCAGSPITSALMPVSNSGKSGKDVLPINPSESGKGSAGLDGQGIQPPRDGAVGSGTGSGNFSGNSADIRGLYLIQPATGVFGGGGSTTNKNPEDRGGRDRNPDEEKKKKRRPVVIVPTSPTQSVPQP